MMNDRMQTILQSMEKSMADMSSLLSTSMLAQQPLSFKETLQSGPSPSPPDVMQSWRRVTPVKRSEGLERAQRRVAEIKQLSSREHPYCLRCGDKGHIVRLCRNVIVYFTCNKLGHKSFQCQSHTAAPLSSSDLQPPKADPPIPMANHPPVTRFGYSEASQRLEASFENIIILTDSAGLGKNQIEATLHHLMPQ
jgi:hypothetical protein